MTTVHDEELFVHGHRLKDKVVVITGAGNGIGQAAALQFGKLGSKVVVGDLNRPAAEGTVAMIRATGGQAVSQSCDVRSWDEQVALFELAITEFGAVDVVVPNAGVTEIGTFSVPLISAGQVSKPNLSTIEVNLIGALYTINLAQHYLLLSRSSRDALKSIVLLASMASWVRFPGRTLYSASKHALLGVMRALDDVYAGQGIQISSVHPFFVDTNLPTPLVRVIMAGLPRTPIDRVSGAIVHCAANQDPTTNGCPWVLPDDGPLIVLPRETLNHGVYSVLYARVRTMSGVIARTRRALAIIGVCIQLVPKPVFLAALLSIAAYIWRRRQ